MSDMFRLIPPDGRAYRLTRDQLIAAYDFLESHPRSGVPRAEARSRAAEVLAFREQLKRLSHLVRWNRQEFGADDPLPHQLESAGRWAWFHICWPSPPTVLTLAREAQELARLLREDVPQVEEDGYERFEFKTELQTRQQVVRQLHVLDYLFHGRTLADLDRDRRELKLPSQPIFRWIVATPGSAENPLSEELLWLGKLHGLAGEAFDSWPPASCNDLHTIWSIFELLKHRFQDLPVYSISHWGQGAAALRQLVRSQPLLDNLPEEFFERWFPDELVRVPLPEPTKLKEFVRDPELQRQTLRYQQISSGPLLPLISRRWIDVLEQHAAALIQRIQREVPLALLASSDMASVESADKPLTLYPASRANEEGGDQNNPDGVPLLEFLPAGFSYGGKIVDLAGLPLKLLEAAAKSRFKRVSRVAAEVDIWKESEVGNAVNQAASEVRKALRPVTDVEDPFPPKGRGGDLAWELAIPFQLGQNPPRNA